MGMWSRTNRGCSTSISLGRSVKTRVDKRDPKDHYVGLISFVFVHVSLLRTGPIILLVQVQPSIKALLALLLGARTLLGAPGIATRSILATSNKKLLGAPGLTTRSKKLLGAPGIATRSIDATRSKDATGTPFKLVKCQPSDILLIDLDCPWVPC